MSFLGFTQGLLHREDFQPLALGFELHLFDAQGDGAGGELPGRVCPLGFLNRRPEFRAAHHDVGPGLGCDPSEHRRSECDPDHQAADHARSGEAEPSEEERRRDGGKGDEDE